MATKKQKRAAALAKRETFMESERDRNARLLAKARIKRENEARMVQRKAEDSLKHKISKEAAKKIHKSDS